MFANIFAFLQGNISHQKLFTCRSLLCLSLFWTINERFGGSNVFALKQQWICSLDTDDVYVLSDSGSIVSVGDPKKKYTRFEKIGQGWVSSWQKMSNSWMRQSLRGKRVFKENKERFRVGLLRETLVDRKWKLKPSSAQPAQPALLL